MPIDRPDFDNLEEADIQELVAARVPEGARIEYKRETYGATDADRRELLKDLSALANSVGGHLLIGIEADAHGALGVPGLAGLPPDGEILRLEQLARAGLEPPIVGIRTRAVRLANGNHVLILRIPRSWNAPHRVSAQNSNRYWLRNSAGVHEASMQELRLLFTQSASIVARVRNFRDTRVSRAVAGDGLRPLVGNGRLFLHIVTASASEVGGQIDLRAAHRERASFVPIGAGGFSTRYNLDGLLNERGGVENNGYTQIFRDGSVEAAKGNIASENERGSYIAGAALERQFFVSYVAYLDGLQRIGIAPPFVIAVTLEGVEDVPYMVGQGPFEEPDPTLPNNLITLPECIVTDYGDAASYHRAVRPAFDALWNSIGHAECGYFNDDGLWVGPRR